LEVEETFLVNATEMPLMVEPVGIANPKFVPIRGFSTSSLPAATVTAAKVLEPSIFVGLVHPVPEAVEGVNGPAVAIFPPMG
jgi:hypothetical protein